VTPATGPGRDGAETIAVRAPLRASTPRRRLLV
jgi:hypothetical protein